LEKRLVNGDILDRHDALSRTQLDYPVNQKEGVTVGQNGHDLPYVELARRLLPGILVFHGRRADYKLPGHSTF
jgi:hypothetical protein